MKKSKELIKNTIIIFLGKASTQLISFLLLPLYTSVLPSGDYGIVDLATTYITLLVPVITLQLEMALFRHLIDNRKNEEKKKIIISSGISSAIISTTICLILYIVISYFINIKYGSYLCLMVIATIFSNLFLQIARGLGDNIGYAISSIIVGVLTIISNIICLIVLDIGLEGMFISIILSNLCGAIFLFFKEKLYVYYSPKYVDGKVVKELLHYSLPLVPNGLVWWIINVSDRTIISLILGTAANGIYAISNKFSTLIIGVYNIFNLSLTESVSLYINDKDDFLNNVINETLKLFSGVCLGAINCMFIIFPIMINQNYNEAYNYIPILIIGMLCHIFVSMLGTIYVAKKLTKEVAITSLYSGITNILINIMLIKYIGIYAAALSTMIAFLAMGIYRYVDVQKYTKIKLKKSFLIEYFIAFLISIIAYYIKNTIINIVLLIITIVFVYYTNINEIKKVVNKIISIIMRNKRKEIHE